MTVSRGSWPEKTKAGPSLRLKNGYGQDDGLCEGVDSELDGGHALVLVGKQEAVAEKGAA